MKSAGSTPSSAQKPRRSHLAEFLPLYKKFGETNTEFGTCPRISDKYDSSSSKIQSDSSKHQLPSSKHLEKQAVDISIFNIDGTNLNNSAGNSTPLNESKVMSNPLATKKKDKLSKKDKILKKSTTTGNSTTMANLATSKSQKRSKSASFLQEEKEQAVVKKLKSNGYGAIDDIPQKTKKPKKKKKSEKEHKGEDHQMVVDEVTIETKDKKIKYKAGESKTEHTPVPSLPANKTGQGHSVVKDRKFKKHGKGKEQEELEPEETEKQKKTKKQKHHTMNDENEGEPVCKSPKVEFIDNLENLRLGDNSQTQTNLIDEMVVVDKAKLKKLRKTANKVKKQQLNQNITDKKQQNENIIDIKQQNQNETDDNNESQTEKKKWKAKRWNKHQVAEKVQNTTVNVDNLPVSLLKRNFKKVLIDHFSKYGLSRSVGEPIIQNEEDSKPVFTTKVFFDSAQAATEALQMDGTSIAGHEIKVSRMRPMTETVLVVRIYGHPDKLSNKEIKAAFREVGLIRSIKPMLRKKKTMATTFIEFDGPGAVERAMEKCATLIVSGKKVMANTFRDNNQRVTEDEAMKNSASD